MSEYRDDVLERMRITDSLVTGLSDLADERIKITGRLVSGVEHVVTEQLRIGDEVVGQAQYLLLEQLHITGSVQDHLNAFDVVTDRLRLTDTVTAVLETVFIEPMRISDRVVEGLASVLTERLHIHSEVLSQRIVSDLLTARLKIKDRLIGLREDVVAETLRVTDSVLDQAVAIDRVAERLRLVDQPVEQVLQQVQVLAERLRLVAEVVDQLEAANLVSERLSIQGLPLQWGNFGQAWTAELGVWGMSRYAPFAITGLAVIDGALYATGPDGVYAFDGSDENMVAELRTGKLDTGGDRLMRPIESHVEYELDGEAAMDVTLTQSGSAAETYSFALPPWPSKELTNERFRFGRGLRGRHFSYTLRLTGKSAYLNDWKVLAEPSKRSL